MGDFDPFGTAAVTSAHHTTASSVPTVVQATDPFAPAPTPYVAAATPSVPSAAATAQTPSHNPFDDFAPAPPATNTTNTANTTTAAPPAAPAADDFAILMGSTPVKSTPPAAAAQTAGSGIATSTAAQEFDDFLASLEKKK